jgi:hypothetical protein
VLDSVLFLPSFICFMGKWLFFSLLLGFFQLNGEAICMSHIFLLKRAMSQTDHLITTDSSVSIEI